MKRFIYFSLIILALTLSTFAQNSRTNRIYRPCPGSTTPAAVTISVLGAISVTPCSGQTVTIDGVAFPSGGLTSGSVLFAGSSGALSQNNANFNWNNTSNQLTLATDSTSPSLYVQSGGSSGAYTLAQASNDGLQGYFLRVLRSRGTVSSPTALQAGDNLFLLTVRGYTTSFSSTGDSNIRITAAENFTASAKGTYVTFNLATVGTTTVPETLRIYSQQGIFNSASQIGWSATTTPSALDTGFARQSAGVIRATDGSTAIRALIGGGAAVASANPLPTPTGRVFHVTGTTGFNAIQSGNFAAGVCITMIFDDALTVTDNAIALDLAGNFVTTANDTLSLCYDGDRWYETGRSVN